MLYGDDSHELPQSDGSTDRWLAVQSAYVEFRRAAEALECTHQSTNDLSATERLRLNMLEGRQRVAFERYLDARLEFLEFRLDEDNQTEATRYSGAGSRLAFPDGRQVLEILVVLLLCATAFSLVRELKHVRDLEAARDELQATLKQTRDGLQLLKQRVDAWGPPRPAAIRQVAHIPQGPASRARSGMPQAARQKPSGGWKSVTGNDRPTRSNQADILGRGRPQLQPYKPPVTWSFRGR
jgi:hypothetical protein